MCVLWIPHKTRRTDVGLHEYLVLSPIHAYSGEQEMKKPRVFWLHFNRFGAKRGTKDAWTVHLSDRCIQTPKVEVRVPIETIYKGDMAPQPRAFLRGRGIVRAYKGRVVIV